MTWVMISKSPHGRQIQKKNHKVKFSINKKLRGEIEKKIIIKRIQYKSNNNQENKDRI